MFWTPPSYSEGPEIVTYAYRHTDYPWLPLSYVWILDSWGGIDAAAFQLRFTTCGPGIYLLERHRHPEITMLVTIPRK